MAAAGHKATRRFQAPKSKLPPWVRRWIWKRLHRFLISGTIIGAVTRAGWVSPLLGAVESVARASEASTMAAGAIAQAGANVTVSFANFAVEALSSSLTLSEELWRGIDLRHVNVTCTIGRVAAPDADLLSEWIKDGGNGLLPEDFAVRMSTAVSNLSRSRPIAETSHEFFSSDGTWEAWAITAKVLPSGYVGAVITTLRAEFVVAWANPVWEAFGVDPHREADGIAASVRRVVSSLEAPPPQALEISDSSLGTSSMPLLQVKWNCRLRIQLTGVDMWLQWPLSWPVGGIVRMCPHRSRSWRFPREIQSG